MEALTKAGCDRRELGFLLTRALPPHKKPLTGSDREDYQEGLRRAARHLREVGDDLGLKAVRDIALDMLGGRWRDGLAFANFCRDLADRLEFQAKHIPKIKLSPLDQFRFDILLGIERGTGNAHYAEARTLVNAIHEAEGDPERVTSKQLLQMFTRRVGRKTRKRRTAPNPHKR